MKIEKQYKAIILKSRASLWDGKRRLPGNLSLTSQRLVFQFDDFQKSHLSLSIPLVEIESAEHFLLFDFARNGLKITSKSGVDLFVLDDPLKFRKTLKKAIDELGND